MTDAIAFNDIAPAMAAYFADQPVAVRCTGEYGRNKAIETVWWSDASARHASYTRDPAEARIFRLGDIYEIVARFSAKSRAEVMFERRQAPASGIEGEAGDAQRLQPEGESPAPEGGDAPTPPGPSQ